MRLPTIEEQTAETVRYKAYEANKAAGLNSITDPTGAGDIFLAANVIGRHFNRPTTMDANQFAAKLTVRQIDENNVKPKVFALEDRIVHPSGIE